MNFQSVACCGVREISSLSTYPDPKEAMRMFGQGLFSKRVGEVKTSPMFRYAVFTQAQSQSTPICEGKSLIDKGTGYGYRFANYIREHNLGDLIETPFNVNPNSNNNLKLWVWTINLETIKKHWEKLDKEYWTKDKIEVYEAAKKAQAQAMQDRVPSSGLYDFNQVLVDWSGIRSVNIGGAGNGNGSGGNGGGR